MDAELHALAERAGARLRAAGLSLVTAESCTGGWVAEAITAIAGSSVWFDRGFVVYSYAAKRELLKVAAATLERYGAVSEETAREMVAGALAASAAGIALAITGIAGPTGGTPDKPVGTVCFAWCLAGSTPTSETRHFEGDRERVRRAAVVFSLRRLVALLDSQG